MPKSPKTADASAELTERAQFLLKVLVEQYIRDGQPVGSRTLARNAGIELSPASVRNVMADLEDIGFLRSPHTSAGRVPTVRGYRFFVDSLLQIKPLNELEVEGLRSQLNIDRSTGGLLQSATDVLSGITQLASVIMVPQRESTTLRHVEFLPLSENRVLAILVVNEHEVHNRTIQAEREYSAVALQEAANFLNAEFVGKDIHQVREDLLREMEATRETLDQMMRTIIEMADKAFESTDPEPQDYVLAGETNLIGFSELADLERLRQLFEAFNRKHDMLRLLDQCMHAEGVHIFIGEESGYAVMHECSIVTARYWAGEKALGVVGVIGPTRMAYERVIPIVDVTAKLLASALKSRS